MVRYRAERSRVGGEGGWIAGGKLNYPLGMIGLAMYKSNKCQP